MFGDDLTVRIAAETGDANRSISRVDENLGDLSTEAIQTAAAMEVLSNRTNDAGTEMRQAGSSGFFASLGVGALGSSASLSAVGVRSLATSVALALVPALAALTAALAPLVTAFGGFVAIAGSIVGLGIAGVMSAIAFNADTLKQSFNFLVNTLEEELAPAIDRASLVLIDLIGTFARALPEIIPAESVIDELGNQFLALGEAIIGLLPSLVDLAVNLATEFLPPFVEFVEDVGPQLPGIIQNLVSDFERLLPSILEAGRLMARILPPLVEFGFTVLNVLGPALATAARQGTRLLNFLNGLDTNIRRAVAAGSLLAPVIAGLVTVLGGPLTIALGAIIALVIGLRRAWQTNFLNIRGVTENVGSRLSNILGENLPAIIENLQGIMNNLRVAWNMIGDELIIIGRAILSGLGGVFTTLVNAIVTTVRVLTAILNGDFAEALTVFADFWQDTFNGILEFVTQWGDQLIAAILRIVAAAIESVGTNLTNFLDNTLGIDIGEGLNIGAGRAASGLRTEAQRIESQGAAQRALQPSEVQVGVEVKGDTDVIEDTVVSAQMRKQRREGRRIFSETGNAPGN